jgi:hypothetical protein
VTRRKTETNEEYLARLRVQYYADVEKSRERGRVNAQNRRARRYNAPTAYAPAGQTCEICGVVPKKTCLDHCHIAQKFRGWLCEKCNFGVGLFDDDPARLEKAAAYLRR